MKNKEILRLCLTNLSKSSVGRNNLYKFFMPDMVGLTIKESTGVDPTDEQKEEVSSLFKKTGL